MEKNDALIPICSFCGLAQDDTNLLLSGLEDEVFICANCVEHAHGIVEKELGLSIKKQGNEMASANSSLSSNTSIPDKLTPKAIVSFLDEYVIGQELAKKVLAIAVYNHYKRLAYSNTSEDDVDIEKSNVILIGSTGTGKTLLAKSIARLLNVPFVIVDATVFTESGYVGEDVESIISRLLQSCNYDVEAAQKGIIYIDEMDKTSRKGGDNPSISRDVSGEGVQQAMLKLLEGSEVLIPPEGGRKHPEQPLVKVNTENILFVCGGAFEGIEDIIANRLNKASIGFKSKSKKDDQVKTELLQHITPLDLRKFGLIPEIIGRLPVVAHLEPLNEETLLSILTEPKNALIKQYTQLMKVDGVEITFEPESLVCIVEKTMEYELGARGLRSICEVVMRDIMFEMPSDNSTDKKFIVTKKYVEEAINNSSAISSGKEKAAKKAA